MQHNRNIKNDVARFLAGEMSREEMRAMPGNAENDEAFKGIRADYEKIWDLTAPALDVTFDTNQAWQAVLPRLADKPAAVPVRSIRPLITAALKVAAVLLIGFVVFRVVVPNHELKTVNSGSSAIETCQLSDGSVLFLNSASRVKFPEKFGKSSREVYFWGEAFFEIAHDQSRPFVIEAGETRIRVLGTSFDVKAYPTANTIEVTVNTGKVLFYHVDKNDQVLGEVTLIKGERGIYDRLKSRISKMSNDDLNYLSWKTGILHFEETPLSVVLNDISEKYNVSFNCSDADIAGYKLTATFDNESLDSVLEVLKLTHHLTFKHNGQGYLVQKAG